MLQIVVEQSMDSALLHCSGRLVAGKEVSRLREAVVCQVEKRSVQLDLAWKASMPRGSGCWCLFIRWVAS
jgi:hypothetical protein